MSDKFKHTVLIVDDEESILKSLRRLLKELDANIVTAPNGNEALKILSNARISLIISDQRMPGMTGVELLQRSRDIAPDSVRILLTGYADIDATVDAINSGAVKYYFNKPWDDDFLLSRIKESLDLYEKVFENKRLNKLTRFQNEKLKELNMTLEQRVDEQTHEIKRQHEELIQSFMETIKAFSTIIELRFKEVGSHSQRVATLAKELIKAFDLNKKEYQDIVVAAFLHDIGKISFSDGILKKDPDSYTRSEQDEAAKHPILGQTCVYSISGFEEIGAIIRHHHEDYDGSGYPDGLTERRIPFGSRVIRLADAFDHHAFSDGYPDVKALNDASAYLVQFSGSKFDPELIRKFIDSDIARQFIYKEVSETVILKPLDLQEGMTVAEDIFSQSGMFLLPKGARLSPGMINRLTQIDRVDPIQNGIKAYRQSETQEEENVPIKDIAG